MKTLAIALLVLLAGCGERVVSIAWRMCAEDADKSCSDCTLSKQEARDLAFAHIAQHSKTDDEIYYYAPCEVIQRRGGTLARTRLLDANYPEGQ